MPLNFLPGRPNGTPQAMCQAIWQEHTIFAYCSGNNLIIMSNNFTTLQTLYLEKDCNTVDINSDNGFIAIGFGETVHIYKPIYQIMKDPKWAFCCKIYHDPSIVNSLKWGQDNELVVGSSFLSFWKIKDTFGIYEPVLLWNKKQPKPIYYVDISEDSQLISSFGKYDITLKLWKRISISGEQDIFHLTLLPHPDYITAIRWKQTSSDTSSQVLYSLCADKKLRIWSCYEVGNGQKTVQNWGSIQLTDKERFCLLIDSWILKKVLPKDNKALEYYSNTLPDLAMTISSSGDFTLHALENLSTDPPKPLVTKQLLSGELPEDSFLRNPNFLYFAEVQPCSENSSEVSLLIHSLGGMIRQSTIDIPTLLTNNDSAPSPFTLQHIFSGHNKSIRELVRSSDGEALLTLSRFSENCVWAPQHITKGNISLYLKNIVSTEVPIKLSVLHEKGDLLICLLENFKLQAWKCSNNPNPNDKTATLKAEFDIGEPSNGISPLLMINTPEEVHNHERHFVAIVYSDGSIRSFEVSLVRGIFEITSENLEVDSDEVIYKMSSIDPVHATFFSNRPLLSIVTKKGVVIEYKAHVDNKKKIISWSKWKEIVTGVKEPLYLRGSSTGKLCIVSSDGKVVSFWDVNRSVLEYEETFDAKIQDIDWTSTSFGQSIVSIGFSDYSLLYTQLRYDYTNNSPSYLPIEKIDISAYTAHDIGDSVWLKDATFVVATGNQLYIKDKSLDLNDPFTHKSIGSRKILSNDLLHLNSVLNGPLPVYHPQFLIQAIYANKIKLVQELLMRLFLKLRELDLTSKDVSTNLPSDLDIDQHKFFIEHEKNYPVETFPDPYPTFNGAVCAGLSQLLTKIALPYLTRHQQVTLITVIEAVEDIMKNESVVDINGIRFLLGVKLFLSHKPQQKHLVMRDVSWALHSDNKELLFTNLGISTPSWSRAREYKLPFWITEADLIQYFETTARYEFTKDSKKDPTYCAIFYLALKKKQVLLALWKMSFGHPEQQKMIKFLNNDFEESRWRTAALKNAYVLLSKHRYLDAATFFLLSGSLKDCVSVVYKQLNDIDLAIGVCRVYEGDNGPVLGQLLTGQLLPKAIQENDRWTTSFIYWKLRKQDISIKALVNPPIDLEDNAKIIQHDSVVNRSFLVEDPALLYLYLILRERNVKYFMASLEMGTQNEYRLILRVVDILRRMGCDYLAASLVKDWRFIEPPKYIKEYYNNTEKEGSPKVIPTIYETQLEPTKTERVRPSLFDMFDNSNSNADEGKTTSNASYDLSQGIRQPKSMLDDFSHLSQPKSMLDSFTAPPAPKSALDDFTSPPGAPSILEDYSTTTTSSEIGSKNINQTNDSDGLSNIPKKDEKPRGAESTPTHTVASKPRNLLDDFM